MIKRFWTIVFFMVSLNTYADSIGVEVPWQQERYEVKSDIINFNYTEMGYPVKKGSFGIPLETETKQQLPRKLVRAKAERGTVDDLLNGMVDGGVGIFAIFLCSVPFIVVMMIVYLWMDSYGKKKRKKWEDEKILQKKS
jgi:hypothetical protein